jgi:arsenate reductase (glutaredoxin)
MSTYVIWHNPRCSKSREALALLEARDLSPTIVRYLDAPPSAAEIERVLGLLGIEPRALMRTKEALYGELGLGEPSLSREELVAAMAQNPSLIERPVIIREDGAAVLGRPPEAVLTLLDP